VGRSAALDVDRTAGNGPGRRVTAVPRIIGERQSPATQVELLLLLAVLVCFGNRSHLGNLLIFNQFYLDKVEINTKFGKGEC
jgi:hypothetical protein